VQNIQPNINKLTLEASVTLLVQLTVHIHW